MHDIVISNQSGMRAGKYFNKLIKVTFRLSSAHTLHIRLSYNEFVSQDIITCDQHPVSKSENRKELSSSSRHDKVEVETTTRSSCCCGRRLKFFQRSNFQHSTSSTFILLARLPRFSLLTSIDRNNSQKKIMSKNAEIQHKNIENSLKKWNVFFCTPGENILLWIFFLCFFSSAMLLLLLLRPG